MGTAMIKTISVDIELWLRVSGVLKVVQGSAGLYEQSVQSDPSRKF
jgi:hypothetical protein